MSLLKFSVDQSRDRSKSEGFNRRYKTDHRRRCSLSRYGGTAVPTVGGVRVHTYKLNAIPIGNRGREKIQQAQEMHSQVVGTAHAHLTFVCLWLAPNCVLYSVFPHGASVARGVTISAREALLKVPARLWRRRRTAALTKYGLR